jgi:hypothetical protein
MNRSDIVVPVKNSLGELSNQLSKSISLVNQLPAVSQPPVNPTKAVVPSANVLYMTPKSTALEQSHDSDDDIDDLHGTIVPMYRTPTKSTKNEKNLVKDPIPDLSQSDDPVSEKFAPLTYMEVQINLRFLGDLKEGEKVMVSDSKFMQVDQRYGQSVRRWWSSDSRVRTLNFIAHLIESAKKYCTEAVEKIKNSDEKQINLEKLINVQKLLGNALTGLGRMVTTYGDDKLNLATIETFKSTITVFCDQDLKRAIAIE